MAVALTLEDVYDPETAIERALATLATGAGFETVVTRENAREFETPTDRLEIRFRNGEATRHQQICPDGKLRFDCWRGQLTFQVISTIRKSTDNAHGLARAKVRAFASDLFYAINTDELLPFYAVNEVLDAGTTPAIKTDDGYEASTLIYSVHFNVRPDSWPSTPTP